MVRGLTTFRCKSCGHEFEGLDIEWLCTALSQPMPCPKCGTLCEACGPSFKQTKEMIKLLFKSWFK